MNEIKVFKNGEFGTLRGVEIDGESWLVGKDVAERLGYERGSKAVVDHVDEEDRMMVDGETQSQFGIELGQRGGWLINESGLYALVLGSKLPTAKKFKRWVTSDVLPAIRKHGGYLTAEKVEEALLNPDVLIRLATKLKDEREQRKALEGQIAEDKPYTGFGRAIAASSDAILVREFAKLANNAGIPIGQNRLYRWLRANSYLMQDNKPYQRYIDNGWFALRENTVTTIKGDLLRTTTLITGKGQMALLARLKDDWMEMRA